MPCTLPSSLPSPRATKKTSPIWFGWRPAMPSTTPPPRLGSSCWPPTRNRRHGRNSDASPAAAGSCSSPSAGRLDWMPSYPPSCAALPNPARQPFSCIVSSASSMPYSGNRNISPSLPKIPIGWGAWKNSLPALGWPRSLPAFPPCSKTFSANAPRQREIGRSSSVHRRTRGAIWKNAWTYCVASRIPRPCCWPAIFGRNVKRSIAC